MVGAWHCFTQETLHWVPEVELNTPYSCPATEKFSSWYEQGQEGSFLCKSQTQPHSFREVSSFMDEGAVEHTLSPPWCCNPKKCWQWVEMSTWVWWHPCTPPTVRRVRPLRPLRPWVFVRHFYGLWSWHPGMTLKPSCGWHYLLWRIWARSWAKVRLHSLMHSELWRL